MQLKLTWLSLLGGLGSGLALGFWTGREKARRACLRRRLATASEHEGHLGWKGSWERPMHLSEECLDPLTAARMTDHNVRGP
jgi:hypothetical protein